MHVKVWIFQLVDDSYTLSYPRGHYIIIFFCVVIDDVALIFIQFSCFILFNFAEYFNKYLFLELSIIQ